MWEHLFQTVFPVLRAPHSLFFPAPLLRNNIWVYSYQNISAWNDGIDDAHKGWFKRIRLLEDYVEQNGVLPLFLLHERQVVVEGGVGVHALQSNIPLVEAVWHQLYAIHVCNQIHVEWLINQKLSADSQLTRSGSNEEKYLELLSYNKYTCSFYLVSASI